MKFSEWEPIYDSILSDMGYLRIDDEMSVRVLKAVTVNSDLISDDDIQGMFDYTATVFGNAPCLENDIACCEPCGTLIAAGSAVGRLMGVGMLPDIVVTDLDGDIQPQIEASSRGAVTLIHAHGDNQDLIRSYAAEFKGRVMLTTQSSPENTVFNFGGFTDGDRAVCLARQMGVKDILLEGFDFENPMPKAGADPSVKLRKLGWAKQVIFGMNPGDVEIRWKG